MNKQIDVLYKIFELELSPPFNLMEEPDDPNSFFIYNKFAEKIGYYYGNTKRINIIVSISRIVQTRIKQTFNVNELSDDDVYHIAKHFVNWLQDKVSKKIKGMGVFNHDTRRYIMFPTKIDNV